MLLPTCSTAADNSTHAKHNLKVLQYKVIAIFQAAYFLRAKAIFFFVGDTAWDEVESLLNSDAITTELTRNTLRVNITMNFFSGKCCSQIFKWKEWQQVALKHILVLQSKRSYKYHQQKSIFSPPWPGRCKRGVSNFSKMCPQQCRAHLYHQSAKWGTKPNTCHAKQYFHFKTLPTCRSFNRPWPCHNERVDATLPFPVVPQT